MTGQTPTSNHRHSLLPPPRDSIALKIVTLLHNYPDKNAAEITAALALEVGVDYVHGQINGLRAAEYIRFSHQSAFGFEATGGFDPDELIGIAPCVVPGCALGEWPQ